MNAPDKNATLARLVGELADTQASKQELPNYLKAQADIFTILADRFSTGPMFAPVVSTQDAFADKVKALKGDRFEVEELVIKGMLPGGDFLQVKGSTMAVEYDLEAGQDEYVTGPPENCCPGIDDAIDITSAITCEEFVFENDDGVRLIYPPCYQLIKEFTDVDTGRLEGQIIDKLEAEAEQNKRDAGEDRYDD